MLFRSYDWNEQGQLVAEAQVPNRGLVTSPDETRWVLVTERYLHQYQFQNEVQSWKLSDSPGMVDLSNDGQMVAVVNGRARWWKQGKEALLPGECGVVQTVRFGPSLSDGSIQYLATGANNGTICVYNLQKQGLPLEISPSPNLKSPEMADLLPPLLPVRDLRFSPGGLRILALTGNRETGDGPALLWRNDDHIAPPRIIGGDYHKPQKGRFLDETHVVTVSNHGTTRIWNVAMPTVPTLVGLTHPIREALLAKDGSRQFLGITTNGSLRRYVVAPETGETTSQEMGSFTDILMGAWSDDTERLALARGQGKVEIWEMREGKLQDSPLKTVVMGQISGLQWLGTTLLIERQDAPALRWSQGELPELLEDEIGRAHV